MAGPLTRVDVSFAYANRVRALKMLDRVEAEESLRSYARQVWTVLEPATPLVTGWVVDAVADHLQAVTDGHIRKLLVNVPPGTGKSIWTNVLWPSWEWGPRNMPSTRYVSASYSERLTSRDNDRCRWLIRSPEYQEHWGQRAPRCSYLDRGAGHRCDCGARFHLRTDQDSVLRFGNDRMGWKLATSIGGVGTGERGDRWIIDDPHNVFTVESDVVRDGALRWFAEVVSSRTNSAQTAFVLIMQRVHELDTAALAIARDLGFTHLCVPMRYSSSHPHLWRGAGHRCPGERGAGECCPPQFGAGDPRRIDGELAWPELFPESRVTDQERGMSAWGGSYAVSGQMQQLPVPRGGGMFQRGDFQAVEAGPEGGRRVRRWDLAGTEGGGDYTVGVLMSLDYSGKVYVEDCVSGQWGPGGVEDRIVDTAHADGPGVPVVLPLDPGPGGKAWVSAIARRLHGFDVRGRRETGSKTDRARPLAAQCESGNVHLVRGAWNTRYLSVMCSFPRGATDDEVDASSGAYNELVQESRVTAGAAPMLLDLSGGGE